MKRFLVIFSILGLLIVVAAPKSTAQLITDSQSKLKTQKSKTKGGFSPVSSKRNGASSSSAQRQSFKSSGPKYSSGSPFASMKKRKSSSPRVSQNRATLFKSYQKKAPRYSSSGLAGIMSSKRSGGARSATGSPFSNRSRVTTPRYSSGSAYANVRRGVTPKYSTGSPFSQKRRSVSPKYSAGSPYSNKRGFASPRYSSRSPFSKKDLAVAPRYSSGSPFSKKDVATAPRYSLGSPFSKKDVAVSPRYSIGMPFTKKDVKATPRYSAGSPYEKMSWNWIKPQYSTNKNRFDVNPKKRQEYVYLGLEANYKGFSRKRLNWAVNTQNLFESLRSGAFEAKTRLPAYDPKQPKYATSYTGDFKKKWITHHQRHPSSNYAKANQDSEFLRKSVKKWNVMWTRWNGNKQQPKAVTDKISKPKFDRKEADIWNE